MAKTQNEQVTEQATAAEKTFMDKILGLFKKEPKTLAQEIEEYKKLYHKATKITRNREEKVWWVIELLCLLASLAGMYIMGVYVVLTGIEDAAISILMWCLVGMGFLGVLLEAVNLSDPTGTIYQKQLDRKLKQKFERIQILAREKGINLEAVKTPGKSLLAAMEELKDKKTQFAEAEKLMKLSIEVSEAKDNAERKKILDAYPELTDKQKKFIKDMANGHLLKQMDIDHTSSVEFIKAIWKIVHGQQTEIPLVKQEKEHWTEHWEQKKEIGRLEYEAKRIPDANRREAHADEKARQARNHSGLIDKLAGVEKNPGKKLQEQLRNKSR